MDLIKNHPKRTMIQTDTKPEVIIPEGAELIDECFYVWETRYGLFSSMTKQGRQMLTGAVRDNVNHYDTMASQCEQDGPRYHRSCFWRSSPSRICNYV